MTLVGRMAPTAKRRTQPCRAEQNHPQQSLAQGPHGAPPGLQGRWWCVDQYVVLSHLIWSSSAVPGPQVC